MNALPTHPFLCFFLAHFLIGLFAGAGFAGTVNKHETVATINRKCLDCHGNIERVGSKFLIDPERYGRSEHARLGCSVCHAAVAEKHPNIVGTSPKPDCSGCHRKTGAEYMASSHASKASCGDCHDPHRVNAPSEISSRDMNKMCAGCHERYRIITIHARWLPQTERHIEMLPCITCHTGSENYLVSIYIVRRQELGKFALASYDELNRLANGKNILSLIDGNADNRISLAALRNFNRNLANAGYRLQGVMSPERVTHSFQILNNRRQCSFCHAVGPGIMQSGFIVISDKDGGFRRVQVEKGAVMEALYGKNFYMTGKMRTKAFDKVIFLTVAGVFSISAGYGFFCYLLRKKRRSSRNNNPDELA